MAAKKQGVKKTTNLNRKRGNRENVVPNKTSLSRLNNFDRECDQVRVIRHRELDDKTQYLVKLENKYVQGVIRQVWLEADEVEDQVMSEYQQLLEEAREAMIRREEEEADRLWRHFVKTTLGVKTLSSQKR